MYKGLEGYRIRSSWRSDSFHHDNDLSVLAHYIGLGLHCRRDSHVVDTLAQYPR